MLSVHNPIVSIAEYSAMLLAIADVLAHFRKCYLWDAQGFP